MTTLTTFKYKKLHERQKLFRIQVSDPGTDPVPKKLFQIRVVPLSNENIVIGLVYLINSEIEPQTGEEFLAGSGSCNVLDVSQNWNILTEI
jgi:hypothetical protein